MQLPQFKTEILRRLPRGSASSIAPAGALLFDFILLFYGVHLVFIGHVFPKEKKSKTNVRWGLVYRVQQKLGKIHSVLPLGQPVLAVARIRTLKYSLRFNSAGSPYSLPHSVGQ